MVVNKGVKLFQVGPATFRLRSLPEFVANATRQNQSILFLQL